MRSFSMIPDEICDVFRHFTLRINKDESSIELNFAMLIKETPRGWNIKYWEKLKF